ncbi:ATP dependent RNA helicase DDX3X [Fasciola gigantica]|uniref:ATP dependent RNA helicase DDX3X n=1 Tax=Fasciola gigantica TaxID=46835 RepID=A0A504YZW2_FASGI|nr:ATP dependent RNA helicase DDX3X [Fasciola gigantica]
MGQPGSAVLFFSERNQNVVRDLVELLRESKQPVPTWLETRLTYSSGDSRRSKNNSAANKRRTNYGSFDHRQPGNRGSSYVSTVPMANNSNLTSGGFGLLGNCSLPLAVNNASRCPANGGYTSAAFQPNSQQQQSSRLMYRGNPGFIGRGGPYAGVDQQAPPGMPPPMPLFQTQPRPQHTSPTSLLQPGTPSAAAMHQFPAAAAAAGLHPAAAQNTGGGTTGPAGGAMSAVSTGGYSAHLPPGAGTPFPGATYQAFHPASMFSATNSVSAHHIVSSHGRDGAATTTMVFPPPTGLFHTGGSGSLAGTTPTFTSTNSAAGHQALQQQQQQQQAATATLISGGFAMPYYGQPQAYGSTAPQRQSPQQQASIGAAMVAAAAMSSGAQAAVPGPDPNNSLSSPVNNVTAMQNENSFSVDSGTASSTSAAASVNAGTVIQQVYRGNGVGDLWPTVAAS